MRRNARPLATRKAALAALVSAGAVAAFGPVAHAAENETIAANDVELLNFVLNLEYLKAEFYNYAAFGKGLDDADMALGGPGTGGATVGGSRVSLSGKLLTRTSQQLAHDEVEHVRFLHGILGRDAVTKPLIDIGGLGFGFKSLKEFLLVARALEDVTVSAYAGIVSLVQGKDTLAAATRLMAAEAQHAGNVRLLAGLKGIPATAIDPKDVVPPPAGSNVFSLDKSALALMRTPQEVSLIVKPFFPSGLNGTIK